MTSRLNLDLNEWFKGWSAIDYRRDFYFSHSSILFLAKSFPFQTNRIFISNSIILCISQSYSTRIELYEHKLEAGAACCRQNAIFLTIFSSTVRGWSVNGNRSATYILIFQLRYLHLFFSCKSNIRRKSSEVEKLLVLLLQWWGHGVMFLFSGNPFASVAGCSKKARRIVLTILSLVRSGNCHFYKDPFRESEHATSTLIGMIPHPSPFLWTIQTMFDLLAESMEETKDRNWSMMRHCVTWRRCRHGRWSVSVGSMSVAYVIIILVLTLPSLTKMSFFILKTFFLFYLSRVSQSDRRSFTFPFLKMNALVQPHRFSPLECVYFRSVGLLINFPLLQSIISQNWTRNKKEQTSIKRAFSWNASGIATWLLLLVN